jgi:hypothetical protein
MAPAIPLLTAALLLLSLSWPSHCPHRVGMLQVHQCGGGKVAAALVQLCKFVSGDSCSSLAAECSITAAQFSEFNPSTTLCSGLLPGQHVYCSAGSLPDFAPQPQANGSCYAYTVQPNDNCDLLASEFSITEADITNFNTETWGWQGCTDVQLGQIICLSSGELLPPVVTFESN